MAFVSWFVAFPLMQGLNATLGGWLHAVPPVLRGATTGFALVFLMTYVAMPAVTRALSPWLYPTSAAKRGAEGD
jgi:antibiotic biosynthesis monooxygenase (ABM) superfamily enzyme